MIVHLLENEGCVCVCVKNVLVSLSSFFFFSCNKMRSKIHNQESVRSRAHAKETISLNELKVSGRFQSSV